MATSRSLQTQATRARYWLKTLWKTKGNLGLSPQECSAQLSLTDCSMSFKKKRKLPTGMSLPRFLSPLHAVRPHSRPNLPLATARSRRLRENSSHNNSDISLASGNGHVANGTPLNDNKDGGPLDWYMEGPGRRVGYDDLTAIDWIFEYTKERQRLRMLYSRATGIFGHLQQILDASQVWMVLIGAGLLSGVLAAIIDVASDWLGDLKTGYCRTGAHGGQFYLNKGFCCWGHEGKGSERKE